MALQVFSQKYLRIRTLMKTFDLHARTALALYNAGYTTAELITAASREALIAAGIPPDAAAAVRAAADRHAAVLEHSLRVGDSVPYRFPTITAEQVQRVPIVFGMLALVLLAAEVLINRGLSDAGFVLHAALLVSALFYAAATNRTFRRLSNFCIAFSLVPLIRILTLSLPILPFSMLQRHLIISVLLIASVISIAYAQSLWAEDIRLAIGKVRTLPYQLGIIAVAVVAGVIRFSLWPEPSVIPALSLQTVIAPALILLAVAFSEELLFRGLLLSRLEPLFGDRQAAFLSAGLFAVMHVGTASVLDPAFFVATVGIAGVLGVLFARVVQKTGSLVGVTIAHAVINGVTSLVLPFI